MNNQSQDKFSDSMVIGSTAYNKKLQQKNKNTSYQNNYDLKGEQDNFKDGPYLNMLDNDYDTDQNLNQKEQNEEKEPFPTIKEATAKRESHKNKNKKQKYKKNDFQEFPASELETNAFLVDNEEEQAEQNNNEQAEQMSDSKSEDEIDFNEKILDNKQFEKTDKQDFEDILNQYDGEEFRQTDLDDDNREKMHENIKLSFNFYDNIDQIFDRSDQFAQDEFAQDGNQDVLNNSVQLRPNFILQQQSTFSLQDYLKTTIVDHYFNGDNPHVKEKLNETIKQVYQYIESQIEKKLSQLNDFEKKIKKFIFDYRYDQHHQPRKYFHHNLSEHNLRQKFQDPKYDQRKIQYEIQNFDNNPFSLFSNEVDVYVNSLTNQLCIKQAFYSELEQYLKATFQDKCDIQSNYLYERRIYHQFISFTFKETNLTLKIRVQTQSANLFEARDRIIKSFYEKNKTELNIFASFVLYWAQKRKLLSSEVLDKNAWTNLIIYFFQINNRLPPSLNYEILQIKAKNIEEQCYQKALDQLHRNAVIAQSSSNDTQIKKDYSEKITIDKVFDFNLFEKEKQNFVIQFQPPQDRNYKEITFENLRLFKVLPIIRPSPSEIYKIQESTSFNYGFFFYKFLYFLNFQVVIDPISISINGQIKIKKKNNFNESIEPIAITDSIWPDVNLASNLSFNQDAFSHLMGQIKLAYETVSCNKSEKFFLAEIPQPVFNLKKQKK